MKFQRIIEPETSKIENKNNEKDNQSGNIMQVTNSQILEVVGRINE